MNTTIEDDALHFFDKHKQTFTGINGGDYIDKEDFEKFAASLQTPPTWVKSNDRLPENCGKYKTIDSIGTDGETVFMDRHWHSETGHPIVFWLDEQSDRIELEKEVERLKGLIEMYEQENIR